MSPLLLGILNSQAAGAAAGAYDLLETKTLSSSASAITFTGINNYTDYKHIEIRAIVKSTSSYSYNVANVLMFFNGDKAGNYSYHSFFATGASISQAGGDNNTRPRIGKTADSSYYNNTAGSFVATIFDVHNTSAYKSAISLFGANPIDPQREIGLNEMMWHNTNAITSISFEDEDWNFDANTRISIYGVR